MLGKESSNAKENDPKEKKNFNDIEKRSQGKRTMARERGKKESEERERK